MCPRRYYLRIWETGSPGTWKRSRRVSTDDDRIRRRGPLTRTLARVYIFRSHEWEVREKRKKPNNNNKYVCMCVCVCTREDISYIPREVGKNRVGGLPARV